MYGSSGNRPEEVPRGNSLINCVNAASEFDFERNQVANSNGELRNVYSQNTNPSDLSIFVGDVLFRYKNNQSVRANLNTLHVRAVKEREQLYELQSNISIVGLSLTHCTYDHVVPKHSPDPVAVIGGLVSAHNTGQVNWCPGDILIALLPSVQRSTQAPNEGSTRISTARRVHELVPLRYIMSNMTGYSEGGRTFPPEWSRLITLPMIRDIVRSKKFLYAANRIVSGAWLSNVVYEKPLQKDLFVSYNDTLGTTPPELSNRMTITSKSPEQKQAMVDSLDGAMGSYSAVSKMKGLMLDKDDVPTGLAVSIIESLLPLAMLITSKFQSHEVGRVVHGAEPNKRGSVMANQPTVNIPPVLIGGLYEWVEE